MKQTADESRKERSGLLLKAHENLNNQATLFLFKSAYQSTYRRSWFKNPFSSKKWHLLTDYSIEDVEKYAAEKPYSRTAEVLNEIKARWSNKY